MASSTGPDVVTNGLVFALDVANTNSVPIDIGKSNQNSNVYDISGNGNDGELVDGAIFGNHTYYTIFAIDYPEGSFGGSAANRQGITPGYNVTSGTKLYAASRALHLWVWNNSTNSWLPNSYFNGSRLDGHCYDSYLTTSEVDVWVSDYNNIKNTFGNNITVITMGSHRDRYHTTAQYDILKDLGAPNNVDTIINTAAPEWILVGKPGLGADNAHGWAFENYTVDPTRVANLNVGIPSYNIDNSYVNFLGNGYINLPNDLGYTTQVSAFCVFKGTGTPVGNYHILFGGQELEISIPTSGQIRTGIYTNSRYVSNHGSGLLDGNYHVVGFTFDGSTKTSYIDGQSVGTQSVSGVLTSVFSNRRMGRFGSSTGYYANGHLAHTSIYNRALTADEILQNYNATRTRFGI